MGSTLTAMGPSDAAGTASEEPGVQFDPPPPGPPDAAETAQEAPGMCKANAETGLLGAKLLEHKLLGTACRPTRRVAKFNTSRLHLRRNVV